VILAEDVAAVENVCTAHSAIHSTTANGAVDPHVQAEVAAAQPEPGGAEELELSLDLLPLRVRLLCPE